MITGSTEKDVLYVILLNVGTDFYYSVNQYGLTYSQYSI